MRTKVFPKHIIILIFLIGFISALCFRGLIIVYKYAGEYYRLVWYCGAIGYMIFFGFRFFISYKRRRTIHRNELIKKIEFSSMDIKDKHEVQYILQSLIKSKEIINYIIIFIMSIIAIVIDLLS